jgi:hypothetical protein
MQRLAISAPVITILVLTAVRNAMKLQLTFRGASPAKAPTPTRISNQPNQPGEPTEQNTLTVMIFAMVV